MTNLTEESLDWAISHLSRYGDTDLFPIPFEFDLFENKWSEIKNEIKKLDISNYQWKASRQIIVQKDEVAFRKTVQLDPLDSIMFAAIMFHIGKKIESIRVKRAAGVVFSYRFSPNRRGRLYLTDKGWEQFWAKSKLIASQKKYVVVSDITDFYNQIYHHEIENQLQSANVEQVYIKAIKNLLGSVTEKVSRGIPVGPHPAHLLAELAMAPIDERMVNSRFQFCRYVDDMHVFVDSRKEAQIALSELTKSVDTFQKLTLNRSKTKVISSEEFISISEKMLINNPINEAEDNILKIIRDASENPYATVNLNHLPKEAIKILDKEHIISVLNSYVSSEDIDFIRFRWFIRRLTQVGAPGGVEFLVDKADILAPALSEIVRYIGSTKQKFKGSWEDIGENFLKLLDDDVVKTSEYMQMMIVSAFDAVPELNHIGILTGRFDSVGPWCRREIVLAAASSRFPSWIRDQKEKFSGADDWMRRAILFSVRCLPDDERKFWLKKTGPSLRGITEMMIAEFVK